MTSKQEVNFSIADLALGTERSSDSHPETAFEGAEISG